MRCVEWAKFDGSEGTTEMKMVPLVAFVVLSLTFVSCGMSGDKLVEASCSDFDTSPNVDNSIEVDSSHDGYFSVYVCGDPSTGHRWSIPTTTNSTLLALDYTEFVEGQDTVDVETAGEGKRRWRYKINGAGESTLTSAYKTPGASEPTRTFSLLVTSK